MKKKIIYVFLITIILFILIGSEIYALHFSYFKGAVNNYINAQQIPTKKISDRKVYFNWTNDGQWEEKMKISNYGHQLTYIYNMNWSNKKITLTIYNDREGNVKKKKIQYPNLQYDK
ncbi:DUF3139 domain-containing protein [Lactobacillus ultunensis]|uniref:DUF3139 domain-containing protein n=1 Tax=Lactobacillus ultunensis TaxID=227945 RepID=UPI001912BDBB|nr:DUF3139 domain-containing protein [Lactobacillus ultunensis]QQP29462.1 DUF3139 domain-containing protein [Lactobacillus ultunensis]